MPEHALLFDFLVLFGLSVFAVVALDRLRLPPIVGFLITGVICGPHGLGLIRGVGEVEAMAEIGVVLLLFTIGIEVSLKQLLRLRVFLLVGGGLQVVLTVAATTLLLERVGLSARVAIFVGMMVALSSTAIVLRLLTERGELDSARPPCRRAGAAPPGLRSASASSRRRRASSLGRPSPPCRGL